MTKLISILVILVLMSAIRAIFDVVETETLTRIFFFMIYAWNCIRLSKQFRIFLPKKKVRT